MNYQRDPLWIDDLCTCIHMFLGMQGSGCNSTPSVRAHIHAPRWKRRYFPVEEGVISVVGRAARTRAGP